MSEERRAYKSTLRAEQALRTRVAVLDAARDCFIDRGYAATTMSDIASAAGVSQPTVFGQGNKVALLLAVVDRAIVGDDEDVALLDRSQITMMMAEREKVAKLALMHAATVHFWTSARAPLVVFRNAAGSDPEIAAAWKAAELLRYQDGQTMLASFEHLFRDGISPDYAADLYWSAMTIDTVDNFVTGCNWTMEQVADWLVDLIDRFLLA